VTSSHTFAFIDESGNFDFSRKPSASKYFVLTSVLIDDCNHDASVTALRRRLAWSGSFPFGEFHCTEDLQEVRDQMFRVVQEMPIRVHASLFEKSKADPKLTADHDRFMKTAKWLHLRRVLARESPSSTDLMVVCASFGTRKRQKEEHESPCDITNQLSQSSRRDIRCGIWPASSDPLLQVADYCCWAIQRLYECGDRRSYELIEKQVIEIGHVFRSGSQHYY